jgi:hypothetical protein
MQVILVAEEAMQDHQGHQVVAEAVVVQLS